MTKVITIRPYRHYDQWVFDDPSRGLDREAFVDGADTLIEVVTARFGIDHPEIGFQMNFSDEPFDGAQVVLTKIGPRGDGTAYEWEGHRAWLCPSLKLYFKEPPAVLHVEVQRDPDVTPDLNPGSLKSRADYWKTFVERLRDQP